MKQFISLFIKTYGICMNMREDFIQVFNAGEEKGLRLSLAC